MFIKTLLLTNFRRFEQLHLTLSPQENHFVGSNGAGKTSIIEAIWLLITGQSFRTHQIQYTITDGTEKGHIACAFQTHGVHQTLSLHLEGAKRGVHFNNKRLSSPSLALGTLLGVSITPDDMNLIKGAPQIRRQFLDLFISKFDPLYLHHLKRYSQALLRRNHLLKKGSLSTLPSWEFEMAKSASYINEQRSAAIETLKKLSQLELEYAPKGNLLEQWRVSRNRESILGFTLFGPHREDFTIKQSGRDLKQMGSEGERKKGIIALKLACWDLLYKSTGQKPLLLIDDLESHLDSTGQSNFTEQIRTLGQVLITSTETEKERSGSVFYLSNS